MAAGSMAAARFQFTLTNLYDGSAVASAGDHLGSGPLPGADLYAPASNTWSSAGRLVAPRAAQSSVLLGDGRVLLVGGEGPNARGLASAELYAGPPAAGITNLAS